MELLRSCGADFEALDPNFEPSADKALLVCDMESMISPRRLRGAEDRHSDHVARAKSSLVRLPSMRFAPLGILFRQPLLRRGIYVVCPPAAQSPPALCRVRCQTEDGLQVSCTSPVAPLSNYGGGRGESTVMVFGHRSPATLSLPTVPCCRRIEAVSCSLSRR